MSRRLLLDFTSPALLLALVLVIACTVSVIAINSSQERLFDSIHNKVASRHAAHEMEVAIHMLRFHFLVGLIQPTADRRRPIAADHEEFEKNLAIAKKLCPPEHQHLVTEIQESYERYRRELAADETAPRRYSGPDLLKWIDAHSIQNVVGPCEDLLDANQKTVQEAFVESERTNSMVKITLLLLGLGAPIGGLFTGYHVARRLSRSLARLRVRVQDVHSQLVPEIPSRPATGQDIDFLHDQLAVVEDRVQGLLERLEQHQQDQVRSEQLAIAGQLATSVAHEIRNPLTAMKWLVDDALRSPPDEPVSREDLQVLRDEIERMKQSVQDMLDFTRPPQAIRAPGDLRLIIQQALELIRARKRQLGLRTEFLRPTGPVVAEFDAGQIKTVLVNLLLNALEAMPRGGILRIRLDRPDPAQVRLIVEDTGPGIPPDMLDKVFCPFVTTKATGTGLGLAISKRLIEEHGGQVAVENCPDGGARFVVILPASAGVFSFQDNHVAPALADHR